MSGPGVRRVTLPSSTDVLLPREAAELALGCPAGCAVGEHSCGVGQPVSLRIPCGSADHERLCSTKSIEWQVWAGTHGGCPCHVEAS